MVRIRKMEVQQELKAKLRFLILHSLRWILCSFIATENLLAA
jgi:hypothetical protein